MKYGNRKVTYYGITFDSKKEGERYLFLRSEQNAGRITDLQMQVPFLLIPKGGGMRETRYIADFVYQKNGETIVEDAKGYRTEVYKIKKKLMYHVHGIVVQEV